MPKTKWRLSHSSLLLFIAQITISDAVKCHDCVGMDCTGSFCNGDYCMMSQYAPRWGILPWEVSELVKGCVNGSMLAKDIRDHCEYANGSDKPFTCFCNGEDLCNTRGKLRKVEKEDVEFVQCVCDGAHCRTDEKTCIGEFCTYVINHATKQVEKGCTNASVPLIERRAIGSCMTPPITGAMHHTARHLPNLLPLESCICGTDYCNTAKPIPTVPEKEKCTAFIEVTTMGTNMKSRNISCSGEYCFTATIKSKLGIMSSYHTLGCASFTAEDPLPEELNPTGCAVFSSENVEVETCFKTSGKSAVSRALASKQIPSKGSSE
ncbi:hypothetical protein GCK72_007088 [Caenorhabditis remanei]|uniref:Uncharacterized protein n=1 Tax=Caenorhabditis remanei TaxID=31234 RepID=A0A6A5HGI9_CAERE|nr:hypothetical protein GCK72_007088 [Caenorhabditis remanei]KAF1767130.1 hypothetical protein GCK72_007088 [Caenorhabditis remanei]